MVIIGQWSSKSTFGANKGLFINDVINFGGCLDPPPFPLVIMSSCKDFCDAHDKSAVFNILQQNVTNFDVGNIEKGRKGRENE